MILCACRCKAGGDGANNNSPLFLPHTVSMNCRPRIITQRMCNATNTFLSLCSSDFLQLSLESELPKDLEIKKFPLKQLINIISYIYGCSRVTEDPGAFGGCKKKKSEHY